MAAMRAWNLSEGAPGSLFSALEFLPPKREVLEMAEGLARAAPHSSAVALHHARRLLQARELRTAAAEAERAVQLAPGSPRVLLGAAEVIAQTGAASRAEELRREAGRLAPLVHPSLRP
jgi:Tfp pilus assembly protein PilF